MRRLLSFDFDGCLFHDGYSSHHDRGILEVIEVNKVLLDLIMADKARFDEYIVMIGSARQSASLDRLNARFNETESAFAAIQKISKYLHARLDTFLLADVNGDVLDGTSYDNAINPTYSGVHHHGMDDDDTKIPILYAQIHKIALLYPNDDIIFDFYDDRGNFYPEDEEGVESVDPDILEHLHTYFSRYQNLIPSNVTLRLNHYDGGQVTSFTPIQGTGVIDKSYRQTIKNMMKLAKSTYPDADDRAFNYKSVFHVKPTQLMSLLPVTQREEIAPSFITSEDNVNSLEKTPLISRDVPQNIKKQNPCDYLTSCLNSMFSFFYTAPKASLLHAAETKSLKVY